MSYIEDLEQQIKDTKMQLQLTRGENWKRLMKDLIELKKEFEKAKRIKSNFTNGTQKKLQ